MQQVKEAANQYSEEYLEISQRYNVEKQSVHDLSLELDRLKTSESHIKSEHEEFEFEKNDGYQSEKSRQTLKDKEVQKQALADKLAELESRLKH